MPISICTQTPGWSPAGQISCVPQTTAWRPIGKMFKINAFYKSFCEYRAKDIWHEEMKTLYKTYSKYRAQDVTHECYFMSPSFIYGWHWSDLRPVCHRSVCHHHSLARRPDWGRAQGVIWVAVSWCHPRGVAQWVERPSPGPGRVGTLGCCCGDAVVL